MVKTILFQAIQFSQFHLIQFSKSTYFVKTVLCITIQFSVYNV